MRLACFDNYRLGVVVDEAVHDITEVVPERWRGTPYAMNELIAAFDKLQPGIAALAAATPGRPLAEVRLLPPVPAPTHLFAAPLNYRAHVDEMTGSDMVGSAYIASSSDQLGFFLKAPGSLVGASGAIELPALPDRTFHHEAELGVVIGKPARDVDEAFALDHVFGYTCLMDITLRNKPGSAQERVFRKSFETFTPLGPVLVTADEVGDPADLDVELWVGDELRQKTNTRLLIASVARLVSDASRVLTLQPGDVYATGTPEGVGPIEPGDTVRLRIARVGELVMPVRARTEPTSTTIRRRLR